jgi:tetratricopeptide (TPR) repeat protein
MSAGAANEITCTHLPGVGTARPLVASRASLRGRAVPAPECARLGRRKQQTASRRLLLVAVFVLAILPLHAADVVSGFEQANKLYEEGKYSLAAKAYDKLIEGGGVSEAIYFNRGNALFKLGQIGRAIASYREAQQLAPRDPDVRANLQFARSQARGGEPYREGLWQRYLEFFTINEWTLLTVAALWIFFALLATGQLRPDRGLRRWYLVAALAILLPGISLACDLATDYFTTTAIVVTGEAEVRNGPLDESQTAFKVRDGAELNVLDRKDDWLQVLDAGQRVGWLRQNQVLIISPSARQISST